MPYFKEGDELPLKGKGSKLSPKMNRFIEEYLIDLNPAEAIERAGYKSRYPHQLAKELLAHPLIKVKLEEALSERKSRMNLSADYVLAELMAIVEATKSDNPNSALRGLELLGKHLGLYRDRQEISGPDGGAIEMEQKVKENVADFRSRIARLAKRAGTDGATVVPIREGTSGT